MRCAAAAVAPLLARPDPVAARRVLRSAAQARRLPRLA